MSCATGLWHTVTLDDEGCVHSFGSGNRGQLGIDNDLNDYLPVQVSNLPKIKQVSCGLLFTVCLDYDGFVWSFGENLHGQLGAGRRKNIKRPQKIEEIPPMKSIYCGGFHTLLLSNDDTIWSCGKNEHGQLCLGNNEFQSNIKQTSCSNVSKICAGALFSLFQNINGEIFGCGSNISGELGLGFNNPFQLEVSIIYNQPPNIIQFSCGFNHSLFLDVEGNVFSVGYNEIGNLGLGNNTNQNELQKIPNIPPIQSISCIGNSCYLIDFDDNLWSFGNNQYGQLGHGDDVALNSPTKINSIKNIVQISIGYGDHFLAKDSDNKIIVTGDNGWGQIAAENTSDPIETPEVIDSKYFKIWGNNPKPNHKKSARK